VSDLKEIFAKNLKRIRESKDLSQSALGAKVGKQKAYISQLESGRVGFSADSLELFSKALMVPPAEFLRQEKQNFLEAAQVLFLSLNDQVAELKTEMENEEVDREKRESSEEVAGRLLHLSAAIVDAFKFFLGFRSSIFKGKKDQMSVYGDFFESYKKSLYVESKNEAGETDWQLKPETPFEIKAILDSASNENLPLTKEESILLIQRSLPTLDQRELNILTGKIDDFMSLKKLNKDSSIG
jgi:transcriptional regulator with XRE-family HTH domain